MVESSGMDGDIGEMDYEYGYGYGVYILYIYIYMESNSCEKQEMDGYGWIWMDMDGYGILVNTVYQWNVNGRLKLLMTYCWIEWDLIWMNLIMPSLNEMSSLE